MGCGGTSFCLLYLEPLWPLVAPDENPCVLVKLQLQGLLRILTQCGILPLP